jgi:outer membrane protein assembly factor BamB
MPTVRSFHLSINQRLGVMPSLWVVLSLAILITLSGCNSAPTDPEANQELAAQVSSDSHSATQTSDQPSQPTIRWEYTGDEAFESTPAIADGRVIIADVMGKIYAIDRDTGQEIWKVDYDTGFLAAAVIKGDSVFLGDVEGFLYCLSAADGKERWRAETDGEISGTAALHKDNVLIASQDGKLYCFKQNDGLPVWQYQTDDQIQCSPRVAGDRTFLGGCDGRLHIVDLNTGEAAGEPLPLGGPTGSTPAVAGSVAVVPIMDGVVYAFDWEQQEQLWTYEDEERLQEYRNSPAIDGDLVVLSSQFKQVDAISLKTGQQVWRHTLRRRADASPVIHGSNVWIAASDGRLIRLDLATGKPNGWEYESRGEFYAAPIIEGNELLIADDNGVVRCFSNINDGQE